MASNRELEKWQRHSTRLAVLGSLSTLLVAAVTLDVILWENDALVFGIPISTAFVTLVFPVILFGVLVLHYRRQAIASRRHEISEG